MEWYDDGTIKIKKTEDISCFYYSSGHIGIALRIKNGNKHGMGVRYFDLTNKV